MCWASSGVVKQQVDDRRAGCLPWSRSRSSRTVSRSSRCSRPRPGCPFPGATRALAVAWSVSVSIVPPSDLDGRSREPTRPTAGAHRTNSKVREVRVGVAERSGRSAQDRAEPQAERPAAGERRPVPRVFGERLDRGQEAHMGAPRGAEHLGGSQRRRRGERSAFTPSPPLAASATSIGARRPSRHA